MKSADSRTDQSDVPRFSESRRSSLRALLPGFAVGALFWIVDSAIHAIVHQASIWPQLLHPAPQDSIPRILTFVAATCASWLIAKERFDRVASAFAKFTIDHSGDAIHWISRSGRIFYANRAAYTRLGYTREEFRKLTLPEIDPLFPREVWEPHWEELKRRKTLTIETLHRTKEGRDIPVEVIARYMVFRGQEFNCGFVRDISERKKAEQELREREERIRLILDSTGEGMMGVDNGGRCTFINPAGVRLLGYDSAAELLGQKLHHRIHHTRRDGTRYPSRECRPYQAILKQQNVLIDDELFWRRDGSSFPVEYRVHPIIQDGRQLGGVYSFSDISVRLSRLQRLKDYAEKLKEANRLKDLFTDILRHDILNPATAIRISASLLGRLPLEPAAAKVAGNISRSAKSLIELCENAAEYARVASAESLEFRETNLCALVQDTLRDFEPLAAEKKIRIERDAQVCMAEVHPAISEVFSNLLSNAIKYSPAGSRIRLHLEVTDAAWNFSVSDQGEGIPDPDKERIFTRFERLEKKEVKGTGLGLAIARQVVQLHGGRIWVEDNPGGGSVFRVEVPRKARPARAA
ncbi:MAG: PAS domain S-box protein [Oligoflexia bacterium]|nr:PAS domain S-box protein [Oligoflexia bacterium]